MSSLETSSLELVYCNKHDEGFVRMVDNYTSRCSDDCRGGTCEVHGYYDLDSGVRTMLHDSEFYRKKGGGFEDWCWDHVIEKYIGKSRDRKIP